MDTAALSVRTTIPVTPNSSSGLDNPDSIYSYPFRALSDPQLSHNHISRQAAFDTYQQICTYQVNPLGNLRRPQPSLPRRDRVPQPDIRIASK